MTVDVAVLGFNSVLASLTVSVDVNNTEPYFDRHWSQFEPNMSTDIRGHRAYSTSSSLDG